jgi:hypothetical protein
MSEEMPDGKYTQLELIRREEKAFQKFAAICSANEDAVNVPKIYYDITDGDHAAAAILDEILFWTLPNKKRNSIALRVRKEGILWLAVSRSEWWDRKRLSERQADRGIEKLVELGLVDKCIHRYNGHGQMHLRVIGKEFFVRYGAALQINYLSGADEDPEPMQEIKDLYEMMGITDAPGLSESPNGELRNGDTDSPNGDRESPNGDTLNSPQPAPNQPPKESPALHLFIDRFGKFHGEKELKRWLVIVDAVGAEQAESIATWAEKKEIHFDNRPGLLDSLETAAKNWREKQVRGNKSSRQLHQSERTPEEIERDSEIARRALMPCQP